MCLFTSSKASKPGKSFSELRFDDILIQVSQTKGQVPKSFFFFFREARDIFSILRIRFLGNLWVYQFHRVLITWKTLISNNCVSIFTQF